MSGRPKRALGQNFLVDPNHQRKIVDAVSFDAVDTVVEIGPGRGAITEGLLRRASALVVIEKDPELAVAWAGRTASEPHLRVIEGDVLDVPMQSLGEPARMSVVGNIPYNLTTPILFHLLERPRPLEIVLMVQREVAERIAAEPGTRDYGALSVGVRSVATAETLFRVPATAFRPRPRVQSAVIRIVPVRPVPMSVDDERWVRRATRASFQWRRKQLAKILRDHPDLVLGSAANEVLDEVGVAPDVRPETLAPEAFVRLGRALRARLGTRGEEPATPTTD